MLTEMMAHFGMVRDLHAAGYYETPHHRQLAKDLHTAIHAGRLIAFTGIVGSGKTLLLRQVESELIRENKVTVSKSLSVDKDRATLPTLIAALFYDLSPEKDPRIPTQGEKRERELRDLVRKGKKPVVLIVDEAHDLHSKTLTGLKRLREVVMDGGGMLSIVLAGHPKLRNDLRRPTMEEIGHRFTALAFDGMAGYQRDYILWLLRHCVTEDTAVSSLIEDEAIDLLAARLKTPLQIEQYLTLAFEETFRVGERTVTTTVVETVMSRQMDELEPRLTRYGYDVKSLAEQFHTKPSEIRSFLQGQLDATRTRELTEQMLTAGLPV
jgi:type II secretory pathway predicted ATPase ExeA